MDRMRTKQTVSLKMFDCEEIFSIIKKRGPYSAKEEEILRILKLNWNYRYYQCIPLIKFSD